MVAAVIFAIFVGLHVGGTPFGVRTARKTIDGFLCGSGNGSRRRLCSEEEGNGQKDTERAFHECGRKKSVKNCARSSGGRKDHFMDILAFCGLNPCICRKKNIHPSSEHAYGHSSPTPFFSAEKSCIRHHPGSQ